MAAPPRPSDPYAALLWLAERELEHAGAGEYSALAGIAREREAIIATLPSTPPAEARDTLVLTALMQERVAVELQRGREQTLLLMRRVRLARETAQGYIRSFGETPEPVHIDGHA
jgi:hypothetical protein